MANAVRGEAALRIGGRAYTLAFDVNALCEIEEATGLSTTEFVQILAGSNLNFKVLTAVLWGGLRRHHPDITLEAAGVLIDQMVDDGVGIEGALAKAMERSFPIPKGTASPGPRMGAAAGIGRRSSSFGSWLVRILRPFGAQHRA